MQNTLNQNNKTLTQNGGKPVLKTLNLNDTLFEEARYLELVLSNLQTEFELLDVDDYLNTIRLLLEIEHHKRELKTLYEDLDYSTSSLSTVFDCRYSRINDQNDL